MAISHNHPYSQPLRIFVTPSASDCRNVARELLLVIIIKVRVEYPKNLRPKMFFCRSLNCVVG
jgi:hypothetical protein